jgi:ribose 5-phosphate isomerase B
MKIMIIGIGCDHAGYELKNKLIEWLRGHKYEIIDFGPFSSESVDYPEFAHKVASNVADGTCQKGIVICGSGNGVSMTANKYPGIRCALSWNREISMLGRLHNDANICGIPARYVTENEAIEIVKVFLETEFEGGRHLRRVQSIPISIQ